MERPPPRSPDLSWPPTTLFSDNQGAHCKTEVKTRFLPCSNSLGLPLHSSERPRLPMAYGALHNPAPASLSTIIPSTVPDPLLQPHGPSPCSSLSLCLGHPSLGLHPAHPHFIQSSVPMPPPGRGLPGPPSLKEPQPPPWDAVAP